MPICPPPSVCTDNLKNSKTNWFCSLFSINNNNLWTNCFLKSALKGFVVNNDITCRRLIGKVMFEDVSFRIETYLDSSKLLFKCVYSENILNIDIVCRCLYLNLGVVGFETSSKVPKHRYEYTTRHEFVWTTNALSESKFLTHYLNV